MFEVKNKPRQQQVKREEKRLPYTIKEIKHPDEIKAWRAAVEERSIVRRQEMRAAAMNTFDTHQGPIETVSAATKAYNSLKDTLPKVSAPKVLTPEPKKSWISRTYEYLMNKFLNIEFN